MMDENVAEPNVMEENEGGVEQKDHSGMNNGIVYGMLFGATAGIVFGINIGLAAAIGMCIGMAYGSYSDAQKAKELGQ